MDYKYISCNRLTPDFVAQLNNFSEVSGYTPFYESGIFSEMGFLSGFEHYHFLTADNTIISFIGLMPVSKLQTKDCPENDNSVELTGFTLVQYRHKGLFTMLLNTVMAELNRLNIKVYSAGKLDFPFIENQYICSDYMLELDLSKEKVRFNLNSAYEAVLAASNILEPEITEYSYDAENEAEASEAEYTYVLSDPDNAYGLLKLSVEDNYACLHHVIVRRRFRGFGYGKRLLLGALNMFSENFYGRVLLHVTADNKPALHIYEAAGFQTIQQTDTYSVTFSAL
jgi:ribosomal protein S18 acetylase RimI-like enzyme